jgi:hypothetical protein
MRGTPIQAYMWVKTLNLGLSLAFPLTPVSVWTLDYFINDKHIKDRVVNIPRDVYSYFSIQQSEIFLFFHSTVRDILIFPFSSQRYSYFSIQQSEIFLFFHSTVREIPIREIPILPFYCQRNSIFSIQLSEKFLFFHSTVREIPIFLFKCQRNSYFSMQLLEKFYSFLFSC